MILQVLNIINEMNYKLFLLVLPKLAAHIELLLANEPHSIQKCVTTETCMRNYHKFISTCFEVHFCPITIYKLPYILGHSLLLVTWSGLCFIQFVLLQIKWGAFSDFFFFKSFSCYLMFPVSKICVRKVWVTCVTILQ